MGKYWLPWLVGMPAETALAICSVIFGGVLARLPKLRIAFAHGGGSVPRHARPHRARLPTRPDLCAVDNAASARADYLGKFYVDSLVHDADALRDADPPNRPGTHRTGDRLSVPARRSGAGQADRIARRLVAGHARADAVRARRWSFSASGGRPSSDDGQRASPTNRSLANSMPQIALAPFRDEFHIPECDGKPVIYFCGHSLGLQPRKRTPLRRSRTGAIGNGWASMRTSTARTRGTATTSGSPARCSRLVGAAGEVVTMNSLTVNLHLMLTSSTGPTRDRHAILIDEPAFPSDRYALQSQIRLHGFDPADVVARQPERHLARRSRRRGNDISVVL